MGTCRISLSLSVGRHCLQPSYGRPKEAKKHCNASQVLAELKSPGFAESTLVSLRHVRCNTVRGLLPGYFCPDNSKNVSNENSW